MRKPAQPETRLGVEMEPEDRLDLAPGSRRVNDACHDEAGLLQPDEDEPAAPKPPEPKVETQGSLF